LKLGEERKELSVVSDQIGCPTYTLDLANAILELINSEKYGIYHISNSGSCSWYELAKEIFKEAKMEIKVIPCTTAEFPRPAARPAYSVLEHMSIELNQFSSIRSWREGLSAFIKSYI